MVSNVEFSKRLTDVARQELRSFSSRPSGMSRGLENQLQAIIQEGYLKALSDSAGGVIEETDMLKAEEAMRVLCDHFELRLYRSVGSVFAVSPAMLFRKVLKDLCPIWPFC